MLSWIRIRKVATMAVPRVVQAPIFDRVHSEQANAWIAKWQVRAPSIVAVALSDQFLTVHSGPNGAVLYTLDWSGDRVTVYEIGVSDEPYRFQDVKNALVFLDALLMHYVARLSRSAGAMASSLNQSKKTQQDIE